MLLGNYIYKPSAGAVTKCLKYIAAESVNQTNESPYTLENVHSDSFVTHDSIIICTFILVVHCAF